MEKATTITSARIGQGEDPELQAIRAVLAALKPLNVDERMRVIHYVATRLSIPSPKPLT